jgi:uncharacterized membrane protein YfcA
VTWQFTLTGLLIGSIVGLTGMGGGSLMTPILVRLPDVILRVALGTILFLSGLKLLDVPAAQWILVGGLSGLAVGLATYGVLVWRGRLRLQTAVSG